MKKSNTAKKHADEYEDEFTDFSDEYLDDDLPTPEDRPIEQTVSSQALGMRMRNRMRRIQSEAELRAIVPWHPEDGYAYHCISSGDVDFQSYMRLIVESHRLDYCLFSTWVIAMDDVDEFAMWIDKGYVGRMDAYVGENFIQHYQTILQRLDSIIERGGGACQHEP